MIRVFLHTLSQEYQLAAETFHLTQFQVWDLSYESINYIFAWQHQGWPEEEVELSEAPF